MKTFDYSGNDESGEDFGTRSMWVTVAEVDNRTIAEFAVNGLKSYEIPAVLDARPGFLGTAGLKLRSLRTGKVEAFKVMVPAEYKEEALEVVKIFTGGKNDNTEDSNYA